MISRRAFLKAGGLALFSLSVGGTPLFLSRTAQAAENLSGYRRRNTLVTIFQRGAMDGLMAVSPLNDPRLLKLRPNLGMTAAKSAERRLLELDGNFGLHPSFASLKRFYDEERLAIVHGIGSPNNTRSHFDAQDYMETGTPGDKGTSSGWLNRAIGLMGHEATPFQAVSMTPAMPRALYGNNAAIALTDLNDFKLSGRQARAVVQSAGKSIEELYRQTTQDLLKESGKDSFDAIRTISDIEINGYKPANGAKYPTSPLGKNLKQIAILVKADVGLEVAFAESNGWDTHVRQGTATGSFARRADDLADCINAFWTDLGVYQDNVTLMTMTEFGRTVAENGSVGTDHGRASCMFVLGNNVEGGQIYGGIPELDVDALEDGRDLPVQIDFRSLFTEVAVKHLRVKNQAALFPGWNGKPLQLLKG
ncbi:MAG: DUF1501 domain-containing protein [Calditrichia bacterium]